MTTNSSRSDLIFLATALAGKVMYSIVSVRPSVCTSVCLHSIFELTDLWTWNCVCVMTIARLGLKVKVKGHSHRGRSDLDFWSRAVLNTPFIALHFQTRHNSISSQPLITKALAASLQTFCNLHTNCNRADTTSRFFWSLYSLWLLNVCRYPNS